MLTNKRFVITTTILSRAEGATPADVTWYRGEDHAQALSALVSAAAQDPNAHDNNLPESMKFDVTGVRLDIYDIEPECSGRTGGQHTVPYCHKNEGGCPFHYPSDQPTRLGKLDPTLDLSPVSGNPAGATDSTITADTGTGHETIDGDDPYWEPMLAVDYADNETYSGTVYRLRLLGEKGETKKSALLWETSEDYGTLARIIDDTFPMPWDWRSNTDESDACDACGAVKGTDAYDNFHDSQNCWTERRSSRKG